MTRELFVKYKFKAYMQIDYKHPRMEKAARCMLVGVDFDNEIMTLFPIDKPYLAENFNAPIQHCSLPILTIRK